MTLFRNSTHREIWVDRWCHTCFQPDEAARRIQGKDTICPILNKALTTGRKPTQWDRVNNTDEMQRSIRCNEYADKPPLVRKSGGKPPKHASAQTNDEPLFDVTPYAADVGFVPVNGWPDRPKKDEVDHQ